jgi:carboxypeptidase Q
MLGSAALNASIDYLLNVALPADGLYNIHGEETDEHRFWSRGEESAVITQPLMPGERQIQLKLLALGFSRGTPAGGVEAEVIVAHNWTELAALHATGRTQGKILLLNPVWRGYGNTVEYRSNGAYRAAEAGCVAVLIRTMASFSLGNPHTGYGSGDNDNPSPVPAMALATEDVDLLDRMLARGTTVRVNISSTAATGNMQRSRCVVAELTGSDPVLKREVVLVSGHIDSWDAGQGALDDGAGFAISWCVLVHNAHRSRSRRPLRQALALLKRLGLQPKRTLRFVAWAGEEWGTGSARYWREHGNALADEKVILAAETDSGVFEPAAFEFSGSVAAHAIVRAAGEVLAKAGAMGAVSTGGEGADIAAAAGYDIPLASLRTNANAWMRYEGEWNASGPAGAKMQARQCFAFHARFF